MILVPPASSKSIQDGPKPGQDGLRSTQDGSKTVLNSVFVAIHNRLRFGVVWGSFWDRFWLPLPPPNASLLTLLDLKIDQRIDPKLSLIHI